MELRVGVIEFDRGIVGVVLYVNVEMEVGELDSLNVSDAGVVNCS